MYMTTKANSKVGNETGKSITENIENVEDASSNMGKTVEEQGDFFFFFFFERIS